MKNLRITFLVLTVSLLTILGLASCTLSGGEECSHTGGTATCTAKAVCTECGESYGELDAANHASTEFTYAVNANDATKHDKKNACCGALVETVAHSGGIATTTEKAKCEYCEVEYGEFLEEAHVHEGGTATCTAKAVCTECGESYGELDAANHASTEFTYAVNANDATKHDKKNACCGALVETVAHSGGIATTTEKAKCEYCEVEYGELLEEAHVHVGGIATCTAKAVCTECGESYGELDAQNHASTEFTYAVNANDATKHDKKNACCGALVETVAHSGGEATCQAKANCEFCATAYGSVSTHAVEAISTSVQSCTTDAKAVYKCRYCDYSYETVTAVKTGHTVAYWQVTSTTKQDGETCKYDVVYTGYCSVCFDDNATKTEEQYIHDYSAVIETSATCVTNGSKKYTCNNCSATYIADYSNSSAHKWVNDGDAVNGVQPQRCDNEGCTATKSVIAVTANTHTIDKTILGTNELKLDKIAVALDNKTLGLLGEGEVTLSASELSSDDKNAIINSLDEAKKEVLGNSSIYDFALSGAEGAIRNFEGGIVTITIPYEILPTDDPDLVIVWFIADDGSVESINATYSDGYVTFKTGHFSSYAVVSVAPEDACVVNGHNEIKGETVAPTCTLNGYTVYTCSRCGNIRFGDVVYTSGHDYSDPIYTAPTCTVAGSNVYTCTADGCGYVNTLVIPAQHKWNRDNDKSVNATCVSEGVIVYVCSVCDASKRETVPVSQHGHDFGMTDSESTIAGNKFEFVDESLGCAGGVRVYAECIYCDYTEDYGIYYDHEKNYDPTEERIDISEYLPINRPAYFVLNKSECRRCGEVSYDSLRLESDEGMFNGSVDIYFYDFSPYEYTVQTQQWMYNDPIYTIKLVTSVENGEDNVCLKKLKLDILFDYNEITGEASKTLTYNVAQAISHSSVQEPVLKVENGKCDMGIILNWRCTECREITGTENRQIDRGDHYMYDPGLLPWANLSEYSTSGHKTYIKEYRCPCGSSQYKVISEYVPRVGRCSFVKTNETTEGDWTVTTYTCSCGISYQELVKTVTDGCTTHKYNKMRWNYNDETGVFEDETELDCHSESTNHYLLWGSIDTEIESPCYYEWQRTYVCQDCGKNCPEYLSAGTQMSGKTYKHTTSTERIVDAMGNVTVVTTCSKCDYETRYFSSNGHAVNDYTRGMNYELGLIVETTVAYTVIAGYEHETYRLVSYIDPETGEVVRWEQTIKMYNAGSDNNYCTATVYTIDSDGNCNYEQNYICDRYRYDEIWQEATCLQGAYAGYYCAFCKQFRVEKSDEYVMGHEYSPEEWTWDEELQMEVVKSFRCYRCGVIHVCSYTEPHQSSMCESYSIEYSYDDSAFVIKYKTTLSDTSGVVKKLVAVSYGEEGNRIEAEVDVEITDDGKSMLSIDKAAVYEAVAELSYERILFVVITGNGTIESSVELYL